VSETVSTPQNAAEKIMQTLKDLSDPSDDAGGLELAFGSIATMMQSALPSALVQAEADGDLDDIILSLTRWLASHRSDQAHRLLVVELPRRRDLPPGTKLEYLHQAEQAVVPTGMPL
jgi:hypothetical protein